MHEIICPHKNCCHIFENYEILQIVKDKYYVNRYCDISFQEYLKDSSETRYCPICETPILFRSSWSSSIECPKCNRLYCAECNVPWHEDQSCYEFQNSEPAALNSEEEELNVIWKSKHSKPCPNCRVDIEKSEGCNHMTCTQCDFTFCWICLSECELYHFQNGECEGRQFEVQNVDTSNEDEETGLDQNDYF